MIYYKLPKFLFTEKYKDIDTNSKILYSALLERHLLSEKNGLKDGYGTFCFMERDEMMELTGASNTTVLKCIRKLEKVGLLFEKRQGQGRCNKIYLIVPQNDVQESEHQKNACIDEKTLNDNIETSRDENNYSLEEKNVHTNNYKNKKTNNTITKSISISIGDFGDREKWLCDLRKQFCFTAFRGTVKEGMADMMLNLMADVFVASGTVRIHKQEVPVSQVQSRFAKLDSTHLDYAITQIMQAKSKIHGSAVNYYLTCMYDSYINYMSAFSA